ncbi:MAG TPA: GGDEF domain-containing protein, partial [Thermoanaerobaculia bacterium]|nr:GGDEF domain-containing protein [Thermoanaerobaculia bacterium]
AASLDRALLDREARLDPLTGLAQRRVLERQLEEGFERAAEGGGTLAVVMCDLDHFKRINDTHGHTVGDEALVAIARLLEAHRRGSDLCCRYGGEEFTLLLFDSDGGRALAVAERLRRAIESHEFVVSGTRVPLSVSIGLAVFPELIARDGEDLLATADLALYEAKRQGRNRCLLAIGKGRFKTPAGDIVTGGDSSPSKAPQIFA